LRATVERYAVPRHVFAERRANQRVADGLARELDELGFSVELRGRFRNVVALPRGSGPLTLVAAHYDSVPGCPGADDNASGLAALLECAKDLARQPSAEHVGFVAFNAEEDGLLGSRDFVESTVPELGLVIENVHVLEMVGFRAQRQSLPLPFVPERFASGDYLGLLAKGAGNQVVDQVARSSSVPDLRVVGAKTWGPLHRFLPDLARSDHFPFWQAGMGAVCWTDTGNFRNSNYHRPSDTPATLDYAFLRAVTELLCEVLRNGAVSDPSSAVRASPGTP